METAAVLEQSELAAVPAIPAPPEQAPIMTLRVTAERSRESNCRASHAMRDGNAQTYPAHPGG